MTVAELHTGVQTATGAAVLGQRMESLLFVETNFEPLEVTGLVARQFAIFSAAARNAGRRIHVIDGLIAATASVHDLSLVTRDRGFRHYAGLELVLLD